MVCVRSGVQDAVGQDHAAVRDTRKRLARNRHPLLHHERLGQRRANRCFPRGAVHVPPEHDSGATIRVIRLEHEALALFNNEGHQVHRPALMTCLALRDHPRPGNVGVDRLPLVIREQTHVALVTQHRQARFLVEQLATKWIDHAHRARFHRADHRVVAATPVHELADEDALVDQVDRLAVGHQPAAFELRLPRIDDSGLETTRAKVVYPQQELIVGRHLTPIEDRDARRRGAAPPLARPPFGVRREQRVQHVVARGERAEVEAAQKRTHDGEGEEGVGQGIGVRRSRGGFGVVLGQVEHALIRQIKGIDPRERAGIGEAWIRLHQVLFPIEEPELPPHRRVLERGVVDAIERPQQDRAAIPQESVLPGRKEPRP